MLRIIRSAFSQDTIACRLSAGSSPLHSTFNRLDVGPWPSQGMPQRGRRHMDGIGSSASGTSGVGHFVEAPVRQYGEAVLLARGKEVTPALEAQGGGDALIPVRDSRCLAQADRQASPSGRPWSHFSCTHTVSLFTCLAPNVLHNGNASCALLYHFDAGSVCSVLRCGVISRTSRGPRPVAKPWSVHRGDSLLIRAVTMSPPATE